MKHRVRTVQVYSHLVYIFGSGCVLVVDEDGGHVVLMFDG